MKKSLFPSKIYRSVMTFGALLFLAFTTSAIPSVAETVPPFQGVYLKLNNGRLIRLPSIQKPPIVRMKTTEIRTLNVNVLNLPDYETIPIVDAQSIASFVINGRNPSASTTIALVEAAPSIGMEPSRSGPPSSKDQYKVVVDNCGDNIQNTYNIRNIDNFNVELVPISPATFTQHKINGQWCHAYMHGTIPILGWAIKTSEGSFFYLNASAFLAYLQQDGARVLPNKLLNQYEITAKQALAYKISYTGRYLQ